MQSRVSSDFGFVFFFVGCTLTWPVSIATTGQPGDHFVHYMPHTRDKDCPKSEMGKIDLVYDQMTSTKQWSRPIKVMLSSQWSWLLQSQHKDWRLSWAKGKIWIFHLKLDLCKWKMVAKHSARLFIHQVSWLKMNDDMCSGSQCGPSQRLDDWYAQSHFIWLTPVPSVLRDIWDLRKFTKTKKKTFD